MSKQLYEEALADVKKLKEVAEDNAKKALLEAVTPRIKDLIENQLLGEAAVDDEKLLFDDLPRSEQNDAEVPALVSPASHPAVEENPSLDLEAMSCGSTDEVYELSMESASVLKALRGEDIKVQAADFAEKVQHLDNKVKMITSAGRLIRQTESYSNMIASTISEVEDMYSCLQDSMHESSDKKTCETILETHYSTLKQLMERDMNKKNSTLSEADVTLKLTGLPDEIDLDSVGVDLVTDEGEGDEDAGDEGDEDLDLGGEEEESDDDTSGEDEDLDLGDEGDEDDAKAESRRLRDDVIVEIDENMLRREIRRMKALREESETKPQSWGHGPGDVSDDFEDDDMGDPFVDVELTTEGDDAEEDDDLDKAQAQQDDVNEAQDDDDLDKAQDQYNLDELNMDRAYMDEADMNQAKDEGGNEAPKSMGKGAGSDKQSRQPGRTVEGIRHRLNAELKLQSEAKQKAKKAKAAQKDAQKKADKKKAKKMQEAYAFYATKFNESVARSNKLRGMLTEAASKRVVENDDSNRTADESSSLRKKLAETNLFNAKLLFTNKLLQNESLTRRQKAEVIERLDEAKTEREVKLVYESLVKTLQGSSPRRVVESTTPTSVVGSSSRPVRPASTLNEGFEADRWARLAGIVK